MSRLLSALIITGNLVQDHEFIYPYYRLKEAGFKVIVALKEKKQCMGIIGTKIPPDDVCEIITYEDLPSLLGGEDRGYKTPFDVLILPGGAKCMEYLRQEQVVLDFIKNFKGWIGSICHGAQLLISAKIVKGEKIAGYYSIKDDIENAGAKYCDNVCISGNIISASHYKHLGEWMRLILEHVR